MSKLHIVISGPVENDRQALAELMFAIGGEIGNGLLSGIVTMHEVKDGPKRYDWSVGPATAVPAP